MSEEFEVIYVIFPLNLEAHLFQVTLIVNKPDPQGIEFSLPAWIPGSYMIRDFAKSIVQVRASAGAHPLQVTKLDKQTWRCAPTPEPSITLIYEIYAWDLSVRSAHLDQTHGYFNGTSVFFKIHGKQDKPCLVDIMPPVILEYQDWKLATTLPVVDTKPSGFGVRRAENYDELIDHPVEMGRFETASFEACGVTHEIVVTGKHRGVDLERICRDLKPICEHQIGFFGEPAPFDRYQFQIMVVGNGYGGLEHRSSTSLICSRGDLPQVDEDKITDGYRSFLGLCCHEYFHSWNVKRIKPAVFTQYDLSQESPTRLLWLFEGVTSYYDDLILARSATITESSYLELLGQNITRVMRGSGRHKQTLPESSFDAWTKFYKQDENAANAIVSYYTKGALFALCLDLHIRQESKNLKSLDDVMKRLWKDHGQTGIGVPEDAPESLIQSATGIDVSGFFQTYLYSTIDLPAAELLNTLGLKLCHRAASSQKDMGGKPANADQIPKTSLACAVEKVEGGFRVTQVHDGGPAQVCGLAAGDILIAIDGLKVDADLEMQIGRFAPSTQVEIVAFRRDELMQFSCVLQPPPQTTFYIDIEQPQNDRRNTWLMAN